MTERPKSTGGATPRGQAEKLEADSPPQKSGPGREPEPCAEMLVACVAAMEHVLATMPTSVTGNQTSSQECCLLIEPMYAMFTDDMQRANSVCRESNAHSARDGCRSNHSRITCRQPATGERSTI